MDLVKPGISRVVGRFRDGVQEPESRRRGRLQESAKFRQNSGTRLEEKRPRRDATYMVGLLEAVVDGVSVKAAPLDSAPFVIFGGAARLPSPLCDLGGL